MKKKTSTAKKSKTKTAKKSKKLAPAAKKSTPAKKSAGMAKGNSVAKAARQVLNSAKRAIMGGHEGDILNIIIEHHKPLKELIKKLKDSDVPLAQRKASFEKFSVLLASHAKAEEEVLYVFMKKDDELREDGFEGDVEHGLADQLLEEIPRTSDGDLWSARVKVLAELVEHHVKEEEDDMFPEVRDESDETDRVAMGEVYTRRYEELLAKGGVDSAAEKPKVQKVIPSLTHS